MDVKISFTIDAEHYVKLDKLPKHDRWGRTGPWRVVLDAEKFGSTAYHPSFYKALKEFMLHVKQLRNGHDYNHEAWLEDQAGE